MAVSQEISADKKTPLESEARPRRRSWRWLALVALLAILFHMPLLRSIGRAFTVEHPVGTFDAVVILGGDHRLEVVKQLLDAEQVHCIWMIDGRPNYLVTAGILPPQIEVATTELLEAGIAPDRLVVIDAEDAVDLADFARVVASRLQQTPESRVLLVCGAFESRHVRMVFDDVLGDVVSPQIAIQGLPYDDFDVDRWWRSRSGLKEVFGQSCRIAFTVVAGTAEREPLERVDPDAIEQSLRRRYGSAACYAD